MSEDPAANSYQFTSAPHQPKQECTARLNQAIWIEHIHEVVGVDIPCGQTVHRQDTRHHYTGTTVTGAPVDIYWRDEPVKP